MPPAFLLCFGFVGLAAHGLDVCKYACLEADFINHLVWTSFKSKRLLSCALDFVVECGVLLYG